MILLYNALFMLGFVLASPYFLYKLIRSDKWREGLVMRLGFYGREPEEKLKGLNTLWIHAASVGEVKAVLPLMAQIQNAMPQYHLVLTTVTRTGNRVARENVKGSVTVLYFPLDFYFSVRRAIRVIHPSLFILVESELWANCLWQLFRKKIPVALINVRMSLRSYRRYQKAKILVKNFFSRLSLITVPTLKEKEKVLTLGAPGQNLHVVGNLKYEKDQFVEMTLSQRDTLRQGLGFPSESLILIGGSTHPGEENLLIKIYQNLLKEFSHLYLILVPRHPERSLEVIKILEDNRISFHLRTKGENGSSSKRVLVLDTVGELERLYWIADVVFMGKSLTRKGGQNFLEPARCGKPIVFGPHMENFRDMAAGFVEGGGAVQVQDASSLEEVLSDLLRWPSKRQKIGSRAKEILAANQGAVERTLQLLMKIDSERQE
ncbi:MAG: 3-deoxy-D-manno-octulosonic acid transferase [Chlamydiae bacterium]|nr:3-deoxy-D-manno-octulosonic acid transferase [Chlamydiota bacterium]MBI3277868.1 3-deoxy-D-manno-octulosonic acid transferase [Chlamydiota bacterium]